MVGAQSDPASAELVDCTHFTRPPSVPLVPRLALTRCDVGALWWRFGVAGAREGVLPARAVSVDLVNEAPMGCQGNVVEGTSCVSVDQKNIAHLGCDGNEARLT